MLVITIRIMGGADMLETEGLMLESVCVSYIRAGCKMELPFVSICLIWAEASEAVAIVRPRSHKAL
jgi:hypothetical protein